MATNWTRYKGWTPGSGVDEYAIGSDYILLTFKTNDKFGYAYDFNFVMKEKVEEMKRLAERGSGLNTYVNQNMDVKDGAIKFKIANVLK